MLIDQIRRIPEFATLPRCELRALAENCRLLKLPNSRWLTREGHEPDAYCYLLRGRIETFKPSRQWWARSSGSLYHFYPGCHASRTVGPAQVLLVERARREFVMQRVQDLRHDESFAENWLSRFLYSPMMRTLKPAQWRDFVSDLKETNHLTGERIVPWGGPGEHAYVIESGQALVHRGQQVLARIGPGDFFGEDALILQQPRNADVTALRNLRLHAVSRDVFSEFVTRHLVRFTPREKSRRVLPIVEHSASAHRALAAGDLRANLGQVNLDDKHQVLGGTRNERALAVLLLLQRGIDATALVE